MHPRTLLLLGLGLWVTSYAAAKEEVEVLARGPVHEAYAEPTEREPMATPVINKEPPKPIEELPPDQKPEGENVQWIPGYWSYDDDRKDYLWVSGFWRVAPPSRTWVPGSWRKAGDGWQWTGGMWTVAKDQKAEVEYLPKPPAPLDNDGANTPPPSEGHVYVPGSWVWRDRYVWRPGFWMEHREGWVWTSAHYRWTPGGYVYIDGYWDYPLATRGVLFAPVYIPPVVYSAPAYVYTPTVYVREECLFGAFFTRRGFGCYYFGDYFAPTYATAGYVSWCGYTSATVRIGGFYDPLFSYYSCGYRRDPFWGGGGCVNLFVGRYRGDYARPPQTLVQQTTVINNITNINNSKNNTINVNNSNLNNVTMLQSISERNRDGRRFQPVPQEDRTQQQQAANDLRNVGVRRADAETRLAGGGGPKGGNGPRTVGLEVPPTRTVRTPPMAKGGTSTGPGTTGTGTGTGMGTPTPKGGIGNPPLPKGGNIAGGTGTPPKGGNTEPPPPKATPIGKGTLPKGATITPPVGGTGTGTTQLPMPKVVNPPTGTGTPKGPNLNPPTINNPPKGPVGGTSGTGTPTLPKNPPTIGNPPTLPKGNNNPPLTPRTTPPPPSTTLPPPRTTPPPTLPPRTTTPPVTTPPRTTPPPVTTPPRTTPPPTVPPRTTPPPKATPKTKTSFDPQPISGANPPVRSVQTLPPRSVTPAPIAQSRPITVPPITTPRLAPRPTITAPTPRPAMVNPRPVATPRIAPPISRPVTPSIAPRSMPAPRPTVTPRPTITPRATPTPSRPATIPSGAGRRPVRR